MKQFFRKCYENRIELLLFIFWLFVYGLTTSHTVVEGDSGEFLGSAAVHGVSHDPGFPLYSIITRLIYLLPFGQNAFAINFSSAIIASIALVITYRLVKLLTRNSFSALFSVFSLGTYENFWLYASVAQVHVLQVLLLSLFSYNLASFVQVKNIKNFYYCALIIGLGISHSYTIVFVLPSLLIVLYLFKKYITIKILSKSFVFFLIGLLPYLYIIWAASTNPPINWGRIHDVGSFLFIFLRGDYGLFSLGAQNSPAPFIYSSFIYYFISLYMTSWYILPFTFLSLWYISKKDINYLLLFFTFFFTGPFFFLIMNQSILSISLKANVEQYLSYSFLYISILAGTGVNLLFNKYRLFRSHKLFPLFLIIIFFVYPFITTFMEIKLETDGFVATTIKFMLSEMPQNSILLTSGDDFYLPSLYWQYMENYRPDVTVVNLTLSAPWYIKNLQIEHPQLAYLFANTHTFYINACNKMAGQGKYFIFPWIPAFDTEFSGKCTIIPDGLVDKIVPVKKKPNMEQIKFVNDSAWKAYASLVDLDKYKETSSRTREFLLTLADQLTFVGLYYDQYKQQSWALNTYQLSTNMSNDEVGSLVSESVIFYEQKHTEAAISLLNEGIKRNPAVPIMYKYLGDFYLKVNNREAAFKNFQRYLSFNPSDKDISVIENFVSSYELNRN